MLDYSSSWVAGTRGLTALLVIPQSRAQTYPQRGGQGKSPGNTKSYMAPGFPGLRKKAKQQHSLSTEILARSMWGKALEAEAFTHHLPSFLSQE